MRWPWARVNAQSESSAFTLAEWDGSYRWGGQVAAEHPSHGKRLALFAGTTGSLEASDVLLESLANMSGAPVSRRDMLSVPTVLRARNKIAGIVGTLPIVVQDKEFHPDDRNTVVNETHPEITDVWIRTMTAEDLLFDAKSYWLTLRRGADGFPTEAMRIDLRAVSQHTTLGMPSEALNEDLQFSPRDPIFIDGMEVPRSEVIQFISPNPPLRKHAARAIRTLLLLDKVAETYANDPMPMSYFTDAPEADPLDDDEVQDTLDKWQTARKVRAHGYVPGSLEFKTAQWDAEKIQLASARQHAVLEVIRATGLDPVDVGVDVTTSHTYQTSVDRRQAQLDAALPYMATIEQRLSKNDVLPRGLSARFDVNDFLRPAFKDRMEAYEKAEAVGAMTREEIRNAEHRPPLPRSREQRQAPAPAPNGSSNGNGREPAEVN